MPFVRFTGMVLLLMVVLVGCGAAPQAQPTKPKVTPTQPPEGVNVLEPPLPVGDFTLTTQQNKPARLSDWKGKLVLMAFGYTHCPDVCPITLARFKQVKEALGSEAQQVGFVWISVDGGRDKPEVLANYLSMFDPTFVGMTGDEPTLRKIAQDFGVTFSLDKTDPNQTDYTVTHTASWFLVGRDGKLRRVYSYGTNHEIIAADMKQILSEKI